MSNLYPIGEMVPLGPCSHSLKKGQVVGREFVRDGKGNEVLTGLYLKLSDGSVKIYKLAEWKKGSFLGHDTLGELLLASGYVESKGPQLISREEIERMAAVPPMPVGWRDDLNKLVYKPRDYRKDSQSFGENFPV